jgi:SM-20-related protein
MESSRRLSFIFYLNEVWDKNDGGELVIYNKAGEVLDTLLPMPGSFITFLSDEFPHEVRPSLKERRSFTGWMHTKIIY